MLYGAAECSRDLDLGPVAPLRVDIMSLMRAVAPFAEIWERHTTIALPDPSSQAAVLVDLLSLGDLVNANRTQRDKDWPMLRRLVDASLPARVKRRSPRNRSTSGSRCCDRPSFSVTQSHDFRSRPLTLRARISRSRCR